MIVDPDFVDHWKTRMLVGLLGNDEVAPLYVIRLWSHCQNRRNHCFECLTPEALKALCRFPGNANKLDSSLTASGFIRREGKMLVVVGWDEYNASLIASWSNGKRGGRPRKTNGLHDQGSEKPTGSKDETHEKPTGSREEKIGEKNPPTEDSPPTSPRGGTSKREGAAYTATFERFFEAYPRKSGKTKAFEAWNRACKRIMANRNWNREQTVEFVIAKALEFAQSPKGLGDFCPYPATWLSQGRFDDDPGEWQRAGADRPVNGGQNGPVTTLAKAQQRETEQLGVIEEWLRDRGQ